MTDRKADRKRKGKVVSSSSQISNPSKKVGEVHQAIGYLMVKEFYANAWEPDKAKRKPLTYTSMVKGTEISFAPSNIKRVLKLKRDPLPDAPSYHERKANKDYRLDHILYDMCEEGAE
ncbi:hypothetical protein PIB30_072479 [Stylosanthes scabra]|uniref:Uncharacterized protein n=1 Tax=Stylosanthes scabra TaxID=79078 RepID=A0ABU6SR91_9FABA|nr:hypothetical protein [Stylosanthes scabra]